MARAGWRNGLPGSMYAHAEPFSHAPGVGDVMSALSDVAQLAGSAGSPERSSLPLNGVRKTVTVTPSLASGLASRAWTATKMRTVSLPDRQEAVGTPDRRSGSSIRFTIRSAASGGLWSNGRMFDSGGPTNSSQRFSSRTGPPSRSVIPGFQNPSTSIWWPARPERRLQHPRIEERGAAEEGERARRLRSRGPVHAHVGRGVEAQLRRLAGIFERVQRTDGNRLAAGVEVVRSEVGHGFLADAVQSDLPHTAAAQRGTQQPGRRMDRQVDACRFGQGVGELRPHPRRVASRRERADTLEHADVGAGVDDLGVLGVHDEGMHRAVDGDLDRLAVAHLVDADARGEPPLGAVEPPHVVAADTGRCGVQRVLARVVDDDVRDRQVQGDAVLRSVLHLGFLDTGAVVDRRLAPRRSAALEQVDAGQREHVQPVRRPPSQHLIGE